MTLGVSELLPLLTKVEKFHRTFFAKLLATVNTRRLVFARVN